MSKNIEGVLGGQQGRIGSIVAYKVGNQIRCRSYNPNHRKSNSKKAKRSRSHFADLSHTASVFGYMTDFTLSYAARRDMVSSTHHMFVRLNSGCFTDDDELDFARLVLGDGKMASVAVGNVEVVEGGTAITRRIVFSSMADGALFPTDMVHFALYFKEHDEAVFASALRGQGVVEMVSSSKWEADTKYLYAVAVNTREVESSSAFGIVGPKESSETTCVTL